MMSQIPAAQTLVRFEANKKTPMVGYVFWFFFGMFGAHRFYYGKIGTGLAILITSLLSVPLMLIAVGLL